METPSSDPAPVVDDPTKPNLARAVKLVKDRRTGETRPAKKSGRPRKGGARGADSAKSRGSSEGEGDGPPDAPEVTDADIKGAGFLGAVCWKIMGTFTGNRELNKGERDELGEALAPVLARWLPDLGTYAPEIALVVTVWGLYETTKSPKGLAAPTADGMAEDADAFADPRMGATVTYDGPPDAE
jgi:hypothetical protein